MNFRSLSIYSNQWICDSNVPVSAACSWKGVKCDINGTIISINISNPYLEGTLPVEIGYLVNLRKFVITGSNLRGTIPTSIGNLSLLNDLEISYSNISGNITSEIGLLHALTSLVLSHNSLSGKLPTSLLDLSKLSNLQLDGNRFTGHIPQFIANFVQLESLNLQMNYFSGKLPSQISNLVSLTYLNPGHLLSKETMHSSLFNRSSSYSLLHDNDMIDSYPLLSDIRSVCSDAFGIRYADSENDFMSSSTLRPEGGRLKYLILSHNRFTGTLPSWIVSLNYLDISYNQFSGVIPSDHSNIQYLDLSHNLLSGSIPKSICSGYSGMSVYVSGNPLLACYANCLSTVSILTTTLPPCYNGNTFVL